MRVKAIPDLAQLSDAALFTELAQGLGLCVANARRITDDCLLLSREKRARGAEILRVAAEEEAAKVLILIDAIRCPRSKLPTEFSRQLQYFNDHLAKGIYAQYCGLSPATFAEIRRWVNLERKEFYLDGPNDVDWILYNDILRRREETIYVDYVESDGEHRWHDPLRFEELSLPFLMSHRNPVLRLMNALDDVGCLAPRALEVMAGTWRPVTVDDGFSWDALRELNLTTLKRMKDKGVLANQAQELTNTIVNEWLFPLYPLDLRKERVDKSELTRLQEQGGTGW